MQHAPGVWLVPGFGELAAFGAEDSCPGHCHRLAGGQEAKQVERAGRRARDDTADRDRREPVAKRAARGRLTGGSHQAGGVSRPLFGAPYNRDTAVGSGTLPVCPSPGSPLGEVRGGALSSVVHWTGRRHAHR